MVQRRTPQTDNQESSHFPELVTRDSQMRSLLNMARVVAQSDTNVLILGDSGTGKELLARGIHRLSHHANGPYLAVNCAAIPGDLLEAELFGWEKGAFSGAVASRAGRFEQANRGSLLLDEIGDMPMTLQAKLLRVLQSREVDRLGGTAPIPIDARIMATTHRDLRTMVEEGGFREDLFYRLSVFPLILPPLKERVGDVRMLAEHFTRLFARGRPLSEGAARRLESHPWPGNVRELENVVRRAAILAYESDRIEEEHIQLEVISRPVEPMVEVGDTVHDMERKLILKTLEACNGNRTRASRMLDISTRTLRNKLKEYVDKTTKNNPWENKILEQYAQGA